MSKMRWMGILAVVLLVAGVAAADPAEDERTRQDLMNFFSNAGELSPTVLSGVETDAELLNAIRKNIGSLSPPELAELRGAFAAVPSWQMAPEALSASLPTDARERVGRIRNAAANRMEQAQRFREEMSNAYAVLQMMPPDRLAEAGLDRDSIVGAHRDLGDATIDELFAVRSRMKAGPGATLAELPAGLRERAEVLARRGPLDDREIAKVRAFRDELTRFLAEVQALPQDVVPGVDRDSLARGVQSLGSATPEMLYVLREELDTPVLRQAMADAGAIAAFDSLTAEDKLELEGFRTELHDAFQEGGVEDWALRAEQFDPRELLVVRGRIESVPGWRATLPLLLRASRSEAVAERREQIAAGTFELSEAEQQELEEFRGQAVEYYASLAGLPEIGPDRADGAARLIEDASANELWLFRQVYSQVPQDATDDFQADLVHAFGRVGAQGLIDPINIDCVVSLGSINLPLGIGNVSLGSINFNFICNPIETVVNLLVSAVNVVADVIDDVFQLVVSLPQTILDFFIDLANDVLSLFSPDNLANALGLVGDFWNSIPNLPQIPCPPDGTNIPFFGEVGEDETATKYSRYLFIFDKVLDLIPETEISLAIQIPAQVLYGGIEYLGICLDAAADDRASAATDTFRADTRTGLNDLGTALASLGNGLSTDIASHDASVLRQKIEKACIDNRRVASYYLPQQYGGQLELVRQIADETIASVMASGEGVNNAGSRLQDGDIRRNIGLYKTAYHLYCRAYCLAVSESSQACN